MIILDGMKSAQTWREQISQRVIQFKNKTQKTPKLAVVLVGNHPASEVYVANKEKAARAVGFDFELVRIDAQATNEQVQSQIQELNNNKSVGGILLQLPLPKHLDEFKCIEAISPQKDADCLTSFNVGLFYKGHAVVSPCTPFGIIKLLEMNEIPIQKKNVCVVGRSHIVGRPVAELLLQKNASVTIVHSQTQDLEKVLLQSDIVVAALGKPEFLNKKYFKKGSVVIDVGIHRLADGKLVGDVSPLDLEDWLLARSPVPKGVGPMTIAALLENTLRLSEEV